MAHTAYDHIDPTYLSAVDLALVALTGDPHATHIVLRVDTLLDAYRDGLPADTAAFVLLNS